MMLQLWVLLIVFYVLFILCLVCIVVVIKMLWYEVRRSEWYRKAYYRVFKKGENK